MEEDGQSCPKLPIQGKRNILITSALPYVSNVPHLGNIIECVLSADVYARYCRLRDYNAMYICGTNDYGTATETKALEENCTPEEICDKYHAIHKEVYDWFDISFDKFGRTSTPQHTQLCQTVFNKLCENKCLSEDTIKQIYCFTCMEFLAVRLIEGSCPFEGCYYDSACGDQCKKCGKLLNLTELKDPRCKVCKTTPGTRFTGQLSFELRDLKDKLENYFSETSVTESWSQNAFQTTLAWLENGIETISITRDLKWGVPVPLEKYKDEVLSEYFDAPIGYVSITSCYTSEWEKWWKNPENVELYQFTAKENVPIHTVMFPSTQLGTWENWTLIKTISATEYLNYEGGNFSKSKGVGVFGNDVQDTNIPVEVWRYYLLSNRPEVSNTSFEWKDLQRKLNNKLLSNLGNFVNRVLSFIAKPESAGYGSVIPDAPGAESHVPTMTLGKEVGKLVEEYVEAMEEVKLKQGLKTAMRISGVGNRYLRENQFWTLYKEDKPSCGVVIRTAAGLIHLLAQLLEPFMPSFSREVFKQLNLPPHFSLSDERGEVLQARRPWEILPPSHRIGTPQPLFKELKDEEVQRYKERFAGSQADRCARDAVAVHKHAARTRRHAQRRANLFQQLWRDRLGSREAHKASSSWKSGGASSSQQTWRCNLGADGNLQGCTL